MNQFCDNSNNTAIDAVFDLLAESEKRIKFSKNKDLILVLGAVKSGKTSFVQWLAGDNSKLISKEINEGSREFIIEDGNRIGNSTIFPELVENADSVYYDCPGFDDPALSYDITKAYLIKKMADYAEKLKIVFVVNYASVRKGNGEDEFSRLVEHATELVKQIDKFKASFSIVAAKVDNQYVKVGDRFQLVSDEVIVKSIANYLEEAKKGMEEKSKKFIDALLVKNGETYSKIGLFRRPDKAGLLSDIELLQGGKKAVAKMVHDNIEFTKKEEGDFGYTLSTNSKGQISGLLDEINNKTACYTQEIAKEVQQYYEQLIKKITDKINSFSVSNTIELFEAKDFSNRVNEGYETLTNMTKTINHHLNSTTDLSEAIRTGFIRLGIKVSDKNLTSIVNQDKYLSFLKLISEKNLKISPSDFSADLQAISSYIFKSRDQVRSNSTELIESAKNKIEIEVKDIENRVRKYLRGKIEKSDFKELLKETNELYDFALNVKLDDLDLNSPKDFVEKVIIGFQNLDTATTRNTLAITKFSDYWQFLKILGGDALAISDPLFARLWTTIFDVTQHTKKWLSFVDNVYTRLSQYDVQKDPSKCFEDLGSSEKITPENFNQFLKAVKKYNVSDNLDGIEPDELELKPLNQVLKFTLKSNIDSTCEADRLVIKGVFVKLSDLTKVNCSGSNFTQVFSLNKMFIDNDLIRIGNKTKLAIIAPSVEIIGDRTINLSGKDADSIDKAKDGKPGNPGGSSGSFLAAGKEFVDRLGNLKILTNGGRGSDGNEGAEGPRGKSPNTDIHYYYDNTNCNSVCEGGRVFDGSSYWDCTNNDNCQPYNCWDFHGENGADGQNGGRGGFGGPKGSVDLLFQNEARVKIFNENELSGRNGAGGLSGLDGDRNLIVCKKGQGYFMEVTYNRIDRSGKSGVDGANEDGIRHPENANKFENATIISTLNDYMSYLREKLDSNRFEKIRLVELYEFLEKNKKITDHYSTLDLVNELVTIEEQFLQLNKLNKNDLALIYGSFLERINSFAKNLDKNNQDSQQRRKVLAYLYATILSKKDFLEMNESSLVIDVSGYLELVNEDIQTLKDLQKQDRKMKVIQKYKAEFKQRIDKKIEEGNDLIQKEIVPEFDKISDEIEKKLDELIREVLELEKKAEEDKEMLIKKKHELENQLAVHMVSNIFRFLGLGLSFLGPWGAVAGAAIEFGTSVGESIGLGDQTDLPPLNIKPEDLKNLNDIMGRIKSRKIDELNEMIENVLNDLKDFRKGHNNSDELKDLEDLVSSIKERLKTASGTEIKGLQEELKQALLKKEKELRNRIVSNKESEALNQVSKMIETLKSIATLGIETYNQYKSDKSKLGAINNAIQQTEDTISKLRQYEDAIHDTISPMLHDMEGDLKKVTDSLKDKSQVSLDVTRWKVTTSLRDMKLQIQQMTQGFKVQENLERCIEKEEEAMSTIIQIYDRFESFRDQQNLVNYIANICSPSANLINVTDPNLSNAINSLEIAIRSNIVVKEYASTVDALKQWVFPFAQVYLKELKLPNEFKLENNLENRVNEAKAEIEKIKRKVALYKTSIQKSDEYIHNGEFSSKYVSTKPFYVWPNTEYNGMITKLLAGEPVLTKADILKSPKDKLAIKFNLLEVNFKAKNKTLQDEINEKLKPFQVSATHLGNSFYKIGSDQFYSITNPSITIEYSLEKKEDGTPVDQNDVYRKMKDGDLMLSPYAMWKFQLISTQNSSAFDQLKKYKDEIDLELVGFGGYLATGVDIPSLDVNDYYKRDDTVLDNEDPANEVSFFDRIQSMASRFLSLIFVRSLNASTRQNDLERIESRVGQTVGYNPYDSYKEVGFSKLTSSNSNDLSVANSSVDTIGNLLLGQIMVGKMYGPNKHLIGQSYVSPDLKRRMKIDELTKKILPALKGAHENESEK